MNGGKNMGSSSARLTRMTTAIMITIAIVISEVYSFTILGQTDNPSLFSSSSIFEDAAASPALFPLEISKVQVNDPDHRNMSFDEIKSENPLFPFDINISTAVWEGGAVEPQQQRYTLVVDVRDQDGVTVDIEFMNQTLTQTESNGTARNATIEWEPSLSGKYDLRIMALSGLQNPQPLSLIAQKEIIVVGNSHCDTSLWDHVYNPPRLQVVHECIAVTGIASFISTNPNDGDEHVGIRPDSDNAHLVNEENKERHNGAILGEVICHTPPLRPAPQVACENYENNVTIPPRYSYIRMTGSYVLDNQHNLWGEIHPVTSIVVIEREDE